MNKILQSKKGFTLVEVIAAFALTAVLLASASAVLGVFMKTFVKVRGTAEIQTMTRTLMETITGELEAAAASETETAAADEIESTAVDNNESSAASETETTTANEIESAAVDNIESAAASYALIIEQDGSVRYRNYEGQAVQLCVNADGQLALVYSEETDGKKEAPWMYPESFYHGCVIEQLRISHVEDSNLLEASLTLYDSGSRVRYSMTRMLECYNLKAQDIRSERSTIS